MSTAATRIRNKIYDLLRPLTATEDFKTIRITPVGMLQPDDLPAISIALLGERMTPIGDDNESGLRFDSDVTIGISVVRGFKAPHELDAQIDEDVDRIERTLLGDPDFTRFGEDRSLPDDDPEREPYFEAITGIARRRSYPQGGETFLVEVRLEMSFRTSVDFDVSIADDLGEVGLQAKPFGAGEATPSVTAKFTFPPTED